MNNHRRYEREDEIIYDIDRAHARIEELSRLADEEEDRAKTIAEGGAHEFYVRQARDNAKRLRAQAGKIRDTGLWRLKHKLAEFRTRNYPESIMAIPASLRANWVRVNRANPCPVCGHLTWCTYNEEVVLCMRVESKVTITLKTGEPGWLHRLGGELPRSRSHHVTPPPQPSLDAETEMNRFRELTKPDHILRLAESLGLPQDCLEDLRCAYAPEHHAYAFPMRDECGKCIGIRLRNLKGDKWAVTGSRQGLFIPYTYTENTVYWWKDRRTPRQLSPLVSMP